MARIIRVDCTPFIESCEIRNDKAVANGKAVYDLLYETDRKSRLKYCSFTQEFSQTVPIPRNDLRDLTVFCSSKCERIGCQLLSPRRPVFKATLGCEFEIEGESAVKALAVNEDGSAFFRKKVIGFEGRTLSHGENHRFAGSFPLNQHEKSIGEIVYGSVTISEPQISLSPGRAEIRSAAVMQVLCEEESNEGKYYLASGTLPLSIDLQNEAIADFNRVSVSLEPAEAVFTPELDQYGESRIVKADLSVRMTFRTSEPKAYTLAEDAFEKGFDSIPVTGSVSLPMVFSRREKSFVTEARLPEMTPAPETVLSASARENGVRAEIAEGGVGLKGNFILTLLTQTKEGVFSFDHPVACEQFFELALPEGEKDIIAELRPAEAVAVRHSDGSVTAKIIAAASLTVNSAQEESFVADLSERTPKEPTKEDAGIVYRFPQKGEDLWHIAKSYGVSPEGVILANPDKFDENGNMTASGTPILIKL